MPASAFALSTLYLGGCRRYRKTDTVKTGAGRCGRKRVRLGCRAHGCIKKMARSGWVDSRSGKYLNEERRGLAELTGEDGVAFPGEGVDGRREL